MKRTAVVAAFFLLLISSCQPCYGQGYVSGYPNKGFLPVPGYTASHTHTEGSNLLDDSGDFESAAWSGVNPNIVVSPGVPDPWGGTTASFILSPTGTAFAEEISVPSKVLSFTDAVVSIGIKDLTSLNTIIRLTDGTNTFGQIVTWTGAGVPILTGVEVNDGAGVITVDVVNGWYRLWLTVDLRARGLEGNSFTVRFLPWGGSSAPGESVFACSVQLEPGTVPTEFAERP